VAAVALQRVVDVAADLAVTAIGVGPRVAGAVEPAGEHARCVGGGVTRRALRRAAMRDRKPGVIERRAEPGRGPVARGASGAVLIVTRRAGVRAQRILAVTVDALRRRGGVRLARHVAGLARGRAVLARQRPESSVIEVCRPPAEHRVTALAPEKRDVLGVIRVRPLVLDGVQVTAAARRIEPAVHAGLGVLVTRRAALHGVRACERQPRALVIDEQLVLLPARLRVT